jgi:predicted DNA-binding transcriptional regulator AlpA
MTAATQANRSSKLEMFLTMVEVAAMLRKSLPTISRMVKDGRLPQPLRFNSRCVLWEREAIEQMMADRSDGPGPEHEGPA